MEDLIVRVSERLAEVTTEIRRERAERDRDTRAFAPTIIAVSKVENEILHIAEDLREFRTACTESIRELEEDWRAADEKTARIREDRERREREEKIAERRWRIGTAVVLVIAAVGYILQIVGVG